MHNNERCVCQLGPSRLHAVCFNDSALQWARVARSELFAAVHALGDQGGFMRLFAQCAWLMTAASAGSIRGNFLHGVQFHGMKLRDFKVYVHVRNVTYVQVAH